MLLTRYFIHLSSWKTYKDRWFGSRGSFFFPFLLLLFLCCFRMNQLWHHMLQQLQRMTEGIHSPQTQPKNTVKLRKLYSSYISLCLPGSCNVSLLHSYIGSFQSYSHCSRLCTIDLEHEHPLATAGITELCLCWKTEESSYASASTTTMPAPPGWTGFWLWYSLYKNIKSLYHVFIMSKIRP